MDTEQYLQRLRQDVESLDEEFRKSFSKLTEEELNWKPAPDAWSVAECLDHLIISGRRYLHNINRKADKVGTLSKKVNQKPFRPGMLTRWFVNYMEPGKKASKIKAPAKFRPSSKHSLKILEDFLNMHSELLESINKVQLQQIAHKSISSPVTAILRFKIGEAFLVLLAHERRHFEQAKRVLQQMQQEKTSVA
jgi:hypothetical protein